MNSQTDQALIWDDVRYFLALARTGTLSAASRQLAVEHSTVARRVGQLEAALSVRLFDRLARGWTLTAEGLDLCQRAEAVEQEVFALRRASAGIDALAGRVRISAPPMILAHLLLPGLKTLRAEHPGLTLDLIGERREVDLIRAEADIAIRLGQPTEPDLVTQPLGEIAYGLYGLKTEVTRSPSDLVYIGFDDSMPGLPQKQWLDAEVGSGCFGLRSNDMATMLHAALDGFGIALLPDFLAHTHPELEMLTPRMPPPVRPMLLVMHPDVRRSCRVRLVADRLVRAMKPFARKGG